MSAPKSINRRAVLKTAGASTALISMPISVAIAGSPLRSEFVELCRKCVFAKHYVKRAEKRVEDCYQHGRG